MINTNGMLKTLNIKASRLLDIYETLYINIYNRLKYSYGKNITKKV